MFIFARFAPFLRLWQSIQVFFFDFINYFVVLFTGKPLEYVRLFEIFTKVQTPGVPSIPLPQNVDYFGLKLKALLLLLVNPNNLKVRAFIISKQFVFFVQFIVNSTVIFLFGKLYFNTQFEPNFFKVDKKTKPLKVYEWMVDHVFLPISSFFQDLIALFLDKKYYWITSAIILAIHLNLFAIALDLLGFIFYFTATFDFLSFYHFFYVLVLTIEPLVKYVPFPLWVVIAVYVITKWQNKVAIERLYHYDSMNKGFLKSLGVVISFQGYPGGGKTTMMADASLNFDEIFKTDFFNTLMEYQSYFPDFPFNQFESLIRRYRDDGVINNRHYIKVIVALIFHQYEKTKRFWFDYDLTTQKTVVSLGNKILFIADALITYGEAFYYYSYDSSLIGGNVPIRYDSKLMDDKKHFPLWSYQSITIDPFDSYEASRYSKNIDFDSLRMYKKIQEDSEHPLIDIGVLIESEAAKQWGNQYDNDQFKKTDPMANPLNDGFTDFLSTFRHGSLINYQPFMRYIMDYQRKGDMQSKIGELAETRVNITSDASKKIMTLPFFYYTPMIMEWVISFWSKNYITKYRSNRNDKTLIFTLINRIGSWANRYMVCMSNKYLVTEKAVVTNFGSEDSNKQETKEKPYYFIHKKIYSDRFASDALKRYYDDGSNVKGVNALKDYEELYPSEQELLAQNSYFNNRRLKKAAKAVNPASTVSGPSSDRLF
jgi:hypothetical protein